IKGDPSKALSKILKVIFSNPCLKDAILIINALNECIKELLCLLTLVKEISSFSSSSAKWIILSCN
ncbi:hypothetical protein MKX08_002207, partial [Trichoderma sp. CBMAI-0020]